MNEYKLKQRVLFLEKRLADEQEANRMWEKLFATRGADVKDAKLAAARKLAAERLTEATTFAQQVVDLESRLLVSEAKLKIAQGRLDLLKKGKPVDQVYAEAGK